MGQIDDKADQQIKFDLKDTVVDKKGMESPQNPINVSGEFPVQDLQPKVRMSSDDHFMGDNSAIKKSNTI